MPNVSVTHDMHRAEKFLRGYERQLPFAVSLAINWTVKDVQEAQYVEMLKSFEIRRKRWVKMSIKRQKKATKRDLEAKVGIETPGDPGRSGMLTQHERTKRKRPYRGGKSIAVPDQSLRSRGGAVPENRRPRSFSFKLWGTGRGGVKVFKGARRTFMIQKSDGTGGIHKRTGRKVKRRGRKRSGRSGRRMVSDVITRGTRDMNIRTLYRFTPSAQLDQRLRFVKTAKGTVRARFASNLDRAIRRAMRTRKRDISGAGTQNRRIARADLLGRDRRS